MREVTKEEYWNHVKDKDATYSCVGAVPGGWPYEGLWRLRGGTVIAKIIPYKTNIGVSTDKHKYYINE